MVRRLIHLTRRTRAFRSGQRRIFRHLLSLHGSPEAVALGIAIGMFIAFTPTVGFQMLIAAALATLFGASRLAAIIPVWITNPVTIPPIYWGVYRVGNVFWGSDISAGEVYASLVNVVKELGKLEFFASYSQFLQLMKLGRDVLVPMTIGGILVGGILGAISYPLALRAHRRFHAFRERRRAERRKRRDGV